MNKQKKIAFAILLLMLVEAGTCLLLTSNIHPPVQVVGTLTTKEVAEITSAVHRQMWRRTFPDFSLKTIQELPGSVSRNVTSHIAGIYGDSQSAFVIVGNSKVKPPTLYMVQRRPKGWVCGGGFQQQLSPKPGGHGVIVNIQPSL